MINFKRACFVSGLMLAALLAPHQSLAASFAVIHPFTDKPDANGLVDGEFPEGGVTFDANGNMYGTTFGALANGEPGKKCPKSCGNAYGFDLNGDLSFSYFFNADKDGAFPTGELLPLGKTLYGTTQYGPGTACGGLGCGTVFRVQNNGAKEKVFTFCRDANCADGGLPHGTLVADSSGKNVFGVTTVGGTGSGFLCGSNTGGCGTIYKIAKGTTKSVVYSFCSQPNCADGAVPYGKLFIDPAGNLYGTTQFGGAFYGGTIFKLAPDGTYTVLHSFCTQTQSGICIDGAVPEAGVIVDGNGNIFGTAKFGGLGTCGSTIGCGVVFKLTSGGTYSVLYSFVGGADGAYPEAALTTDSASNLYGTTLRGGNGPCGDTPTGCGTVFEISASGVESILHPFLQKADGVKPEGTLALQNNRYLYGATREKGDPACTCGTLFKMDLQGASPKDLWQAPALPPRWVVSTKSRSTKKRKLQ